MANRWASSVCLGLVSLSTTAAADAIVDPEVELQPPSEVAPTSTSTTIPGVTPRIAHDHGPWGGGVRVTGLSGIGALPGVNVGREIAVFVRHHEWFGELALGRWQPQETLVVTATPEPVELALDVWSLRGGWASRSMPLRAWMLVESGELAGSDGMSNAVARMVSMGVPDERRWVAVGGGVGVAWPMADHVRLVGTVELAIPVERTPLMVSDGTFEPDPAAARCALGVEVGWR